MRVAFCISGELRTFLSQPVLNSYKHICSILNPDIFISIWDHVGVSHCHRNGVVVDFEHKVDQTLLNNILPNIKDVEIENYDVWKNSLSTDYVSIMSRTDMDHRTKNSCSQLYRIFKCNELKQNFETVNGFVYDVVFRLRPDFMLQDDVDLSIQPNSIYHINSGVLPKQNL